MQMKQDVVEKIKLPVTNLELIFFFQSMAELLAENYHNIWARKKKIDLEAKGKSAAMHLHMTLHTSDRKLKKQCYYYQ